uniref:Uncharacterized protein n=1 Tax=Arundo donax TaxID=35708 RepID=A0A0A9A018_ARUDO
MLIAIFRGCSQHLLNFRQNCLGSTIGKSFY